MSEQFQPISNTPPEGLSGKIKFYGRMFLDLQILTIFKDVKKYLPHYSGNVLDIGCGQSPYRFLLNSNSTKYFGIDIIEAKNLPKKDTTFILTKHYIDAYVTINIGQYKFKTHIQKNTNPKWYETFEVPIEESNTQQIQVKFSFLKAHTRESFDS